MKTLDRRVLQSWGKWGSRRPRPQTVFAACAVIIQGHSNWDCRCYVLPAGHHIHWIHKISELLFCACLNVRQNFFFYMSVKRISCMTPPTLKTLSRRDIAYVLKLKAIIFNQDFVYLFLERGGREWQSEGEKHRSGALLRTRTGRPNTQPRQLPWPGIKPAMLRFGGRRPTNWTTSIRAKANL